MKKTLSLLLTAAILLSCVSFGFGSAAAGDAAQSINPFNPSAYRRPAPDVTLSVPQVIRVGAAGDNTMESGTTIKQATRSGVPYISGAFATQAYAGETPSWPGIVFRSSQAVNILSITVTGSGASVSAVFAGGNLSGTTYATWEIRGGTAVAGTTLKISVQYTYTWQNPFTVRNVTDTYNTSAYSYVENIVFPSGVWTFASTDLVPGGSYSADVVYISRLLGKGVYASVIGRESDPYEDYSAGYHDFVANETTHTNDTVIPKSTMLIAQPPGKTSANSAIADGKGIYPDDEDRGKSTVYLDTSAETLTTSNFRMHFFIHSYLRCGDGSLFYEGRAAKDGNVSYSGGTGTIVASDTAAFAALNPSVVPDTDFNGQGMTTTTTLRGSGEQGSYTFITKWKGIGEGFGPFGDTPYMQYYHAVTIDIVHLDKGSLRSNLNTCVGTELVSTITGIKTANGSDPASGGVSNTGKGKNPQGWYYTDGWSAYQSAYEDAWLNLQKPNTGQATIDAASLALQSAYSALTLRGTNVDNNTTQFLESGLGNTFYGSSVKPLELTFDAVIAADESFNSKLKYWKAGSFDYYTPASAAALNEAFSAASACLSTGYNVLYQPYVDYIAYQLQMAVNGLQLKQNQVFFNANGASGSMAPQTIEAGSTASLNALAYTKTGYTFEGWALSTGGAPVYADGADFTMGGSNIPLYAIWTNVYTIIFDAGGGTGGGAADLTVGTALAAPEVARTGYTFTGWLPEVPATVPAADTTYTAQWSINQYTVSFQSNSGTSVMDITQNYGTYIPEPIDPWRNGFVFGGWYTDEDFTQQAAWPYTLGAQDVTFFAKWTGIDYSQGDVFTFGSYPQREVTDSTLLAALNALTPDGSGDVVYEGAKYRKVYFEQYTPYEGSLDPVAENSYQDDNGYYTGMIYWFKYEPIQWRVLSNTNGELFVLSEMNLDARVYHPTFSNAWFTSGVRAWLNDSFYLTAFNASEQARIKTSTVENPYNAYFDTSGSPATSDKLFLLSYEEAMNGAYGFGTDHLPDSDRYGYGSDYAKSLGLWETMGLSCWWLRSQGASLAAAGAVNGGGVILAQEASVTYAHIGVRPAMRIDRSALMLETVEGSGCVIDRDNAMIYGLEAGLAPSGLEGGYVRLVGDGQLNIASGGFGTGTVVEVYDNMTSTVLETYGIIIFGDVNGDGSIDSLDAGRAVDFENYLISWDPVADAAFLKAGDVNGDGKTDSIDAGIMVDAENYLRVINQISGLAE